MMTDNSDIPVLQFLPNTQSAARRGYGKHYITMSCHRITDKKLVASFIADNGLDKAPNSQTIKKFGFRIEIKDDVVTLYRNPAYPISFGQKCWLYNIRRSSSQPSIVYRVSLDVQEADIPHEIDFTINSQIEAAFGIYRNAVALAEMALRKELIRVYSVSNHKLKVRIEDLASQIPQAKSKPSPKAKAEPAKKKVKLRKAT